jgi:cyclophilin family peptidyl-prolyl cis-trans isomerase
LRVVYRHFPLNSIHDKAALAAEATEAAGVQDMFWEMHDLLFERQREWAGLSSGEIVDVLTGYAQELELDVEQFSRDLKEGTYRDLVQQRYDEATGLGLGGTPSVFLNGQYVDLRRMNEAILVGLIQLFNYYGPQYAAPPPMSIDSSQPYFATFKTNRGVFCIELFAAQVPQTVNNFVFLAQEGFYDGISFHRVLPGFMAQAGDPTGSGFGGPGYTFPDEFHPDLKHDRPGILSMANSGFNTNSSQFFITYVPVEQLDAYDADGNLKECAKREVSCHAVFGIVVEGMDVVESIAPRNPQEDPYAPADVIETITIDSACGM